MARRYIGITDVPGGRNGMRVLDRVGVEVRGKNKAHAKREIEAVIAAAFPGVTINNLALSRLKNTGGEWNAVESEVQGKLALVNTWIAPKDVEMTDLKLSESVKSTQLTVVPDSKVAKATKPATARVSIKPLVMTEQSIKSFGNSHRTYKLNNEVES